MSELLLDSLEIEGYRCFEHLTIEKLGRVNLIVGKNNIGKTNVLEAIWIYSQRGFSNSIVEILQSRDELQTNTDIPFDEISKESIVNFKNIFHSRPDINSLPISSASIGTSKEQIMIQVAWMEDKGDYLEVINGLAQKVDAEIYYSAHFEDKQVETGEKVLQFITLEKIRRGSFENRQNSKIPQIASYFIKNKGLSNFETSNLWDKITLTDFEDTVVSALKIIHPQLIKVGFINQSPNNYMRVPMAREKGQEPLPLCSLGDGMNRLLGIALALAECKDGILLIDEIENGLHYSIQFAVWRMIFQTARDLNVQVFATTQQRLS